MQLPVPSIYNVFFVYLFLPVPRKAVTFSIGVSIAVLTTPITKLVLFRAN